MLFAGSPVFNPALFVSVKIDTLDEDFIYSIQSLLGCKVFHFLLPFSFRYLFGNSAIHKAERAPPNLASWPTRQFVQNGLAPHIAHSLRRYTLSAISSIFAKKSDIDAYLLESERHLRTPEDL